MGAGKKYRGLFAIIGAAICGFGASFLQPSLSSLYAAEAEDEEEGGADSSKANQEAQDRNIIIYIYNEIVGGLKSISENKKDAMGYERAARAYLYAEREHHAMELLLDGVTENPEALALWKMIANIELKNARDAEAMSVLKKIISLDPSAASAYNNIAYISATSQKPSLRNLPRAKKYAETAVKLEPKNPEFISTMAEVSFQQGDLEQAISLMRKAISLAPKDKLLQETLNRFERTDPSMSVEYNMSFDQRMLRW